MAKITTVDLQGKKARLINRHPKIKFHPSLMLSIEILKKNPSLFSFSSFIKQE